MWKRKMKIKWNKKKQKKELLLRGERKSKWCEREKWK